MRSKGQPIQHCQEINMNSVQQPVFTVVKEEPLEMAPQSFEITSKFVDKSTQKDWELQKHVNMRMKAIGSAIIHRELQRKVQAQMLFKLERENALLRRALMLWQDRLEKTDVAYLKTVGGHPVIGKVVSLSNNQSCNSTPMAAGETSSDKEVFTTRWVPENKTVPDANPTVKQVERTPKIYLDEEKLSHDNLPWMQYLHYSQTWPRHSPPPDYVNPDMIPHNFYPPNVLVSENPRQTFQNQPCFLTPPSSPHIPIPSQYDAHLQHRPVYFHYQPPLNCQQSRLKKEAIKIPPVPTYMYDSYIRQSHPTTPQLSPRYHPYY